MTKQDIEKAIVTTLIQKSELKQNVFDITHSHFVHLKEVIQELVIHYNELLGDTDHRIKLEYHDRGEFVAMLKVAGDMLVFHMHSNAFEFDRDHEVWKNQYINNDPMNSYVGQIQIYNFLNDSFRYNRIDDPGYLIARIFVNREDHFFVEGKRQRGTGVNQFGKSILNKKAIKNIIEVAILYCLQFDLLVQPYDDVKIISLNQVNEEIINSKIQTGKRLGFQYNSDDVKNLADQ
ncbi:MAG: hypothetical protein JW717_05830 [Marinilabiliaceae bacterium]|nr:hypothetical protein [Marinilabiliaceae bacterium]